MARNFHGRRKRPEPENLNRYRQVINKFVSDATGDASDASNNRTAISATTNFPVESRRDRRRKEKRLKKMRNLAYHEHKPIPTMETIRKDEREKFIKRQQQKKAREEAEERRAAAAEESKNKKRKRELSENNEDARKKALIESNEKELKAIKQLEKNLKLNKRKSKNLPQSFASDGLDFLLAPFDADEMANDIDVKKKSVWKSAQNSDGNDDDDGSDEDEEIGSDGYSSDGESDEGSFNSDGESDDGPEVAATSKKAAKKLTPLAKLEQSLKAKNSSKSSVTGVLSKSKRQKEDMAKTKSDSKQQQQLAVKSSVKDKHAVAAADSESEGDNKEGFSDNSEDFGSEDEEEVGQSDDAFDEDDQSDADDTFDSANEDEGDDDNSETTASKKVTKKKSKSKSDDDSGPKYTEDIYGRLRDEKGNIVVASTSQTSGQAPSAAGVYVPRFRREAAAAGGSGGLEAIERERVKKQLKGLANRLSQATLHPITSQVARLFGEHSRALTNACLTDVLLEACVWHEPVPERIVMELSAMVAILHVTVGNEVGAFVLQEWVKRFDALSQAPPGDEKDIDNLLMVLCQLYNFKVVQSLLVFDVIEKLVERFGERDIELLLLMLRVVGFVLRKDDAAALKNIIITIQSKAAVVDVSHFQDPTRVKFMLEVLMAIKNNNMRKIPNYDHEPVEHVLKLVNSAVKSSSSGFNALRVSLNDLLKAEEQGRWWLVGSSWSNMNRQDGASLDGAAMESNKRGGNSGVVADSKLMELARKQRMNTDIRRNIFCLLMSSEDYVDAFEKLLRLKLSEKQEREIIHVVIDLCLQGKTFNPFYALVAQKFCEFDRRFLMTTQFTLWDKFRLMEELSERQRGNLSAFCTHLLITSALSLSVLKTLEFAELDTCRVQFLKHVIGGILKAEGGDDIIRRVFSRISPLGQLATLKDGLRLFMRHFLLRGSEAESLRPQVTVAEKALASGESAMRM